MFFILTSIGKDLEQGLPQVMDQIFCIMRDVFLTNSSAGPLKNTLLQLIELRASKWQMPSEAVMYYYPASRWTNHYTMDSLDRQGFKSLKMLSFINGMKDKMAWKIKLHEDKDPIGKLYYVCSDYVGIRCRLHWVISYHCHRFNLIPWLNGTSFSLLTLRLNVGNKNWYWLRAYHTETLPA